MRSRNPLTSLCSGCAVAGARRRLAAPPRPTPRRRVLRLARHALVAVALGAAAAVPVAELLPAPRADARSLAGTPTMRTALPGRRLPGYQLATTAGDVVPFGAAASAVAPAGGLPNPAVDVARTPSGAGSWMLTADGGVVTAGDAPFFGSVGGQHLNERAVAIAASPSGRGYWLAAADGGVFAFGDAAFHGSLVGQPRNAPIVDLVATPDGDGYWLAGADGGVFSFGNASFHGSVDVPLRAGVAAMAATVSGRGYWLAAADGGIFAFGDAPFLGRPDDGRLRAPVVGVAGTTSGAGYWVAAADGGVFTFGDAPFLGSAPGSRRGKIVAITAGVGRPVTRAQQRLPRRLTNRYGNDISWPQCGEAYPAPGFGHAIVGVTGGRPFTRNRCLASQWRWAVGGAGAGSSVYVNLASPVIGDPAAMDGPAGACSPTALPCQTYNHSANNIADALAYAREAGVDAPMWWLDVEVANRWSASPALNSLTVKAAQETLEKAGLRVGVYSTHLMWRRITGGYRNGLPVWLAGAPTDAAAPSWCEREDRDFTGGGIWLVQSIPTRFDVNYACAPALQDLDSAFRFRD